MANTLTDLAGDIFVAADVVGRELTGAASSVTVNANGSERVAKGDTVRSHFTREATAVDITESMTIPQGTDQTVDNKTASISKARAVQIPWTGEDIKHVNNGSGFSSVYGDQIAQAMRTITNEIETDLCTAIAAGACRAVGTAGTTPFADNFDEIAESRQIIVDNGCPVDQLTTVLGTTAGTKMRNLAQLQKANESQSDILLRQGVLLDLQGVGIKESAQVQSHTAGTAASATTDATGYAVGTTTITLDSAGTGTILAGDVITFAGSTEHQYVVVTGDAATSGGGTITIQEPGLQVALSAATKAITVKASHAQNFTLRRSAAELIIRPGALPDGGDQADDSMIVQDPFSGLVFEVRSYKGYRKAMFEVSAYWGYKVWKPEHVALILG